MKKIGLFTLLVFSYFMMFSQSVIVGYVLDGETQKPLRNVQVTLKGSAEGTLSDDIGFFSLNAHGEKAFLALVHVGYHPFESGFSLHSDTVRLGDIQLRPFPIDLDEITISGGLVTETKTPVTIATISSVTLQTELGDRPLPLVMNTVPGVYSSRTGGGSGDAVMSIRGFNQENIGILLNGIPISSVENGLVYWNNWLGLSKAMAEIQIQKGPGVSNAAINAVGGSLNIVTTSPSDSSSYALSYGVTSYGNQQLAFEVNSGVMKNGWNVAFRGSRLNGPGYIDATYVNAWSYFLAMNKTLSEKSKLTITLLGTPEYHGQRTIKITDEEHRYYGNLYNKDWGGLNGEIKNASENFYHKPFLSLNHYYTANSRTIWANAFYISVGNGGGKWSESFSYAPSIFEYRNSSGQIDWTTIYDENAGNTSYYRLANGDSVSGYSVRAATHFLASHIQTGLMSTLRHQLTEHWLLTAGFHYRYFKSDVREKLTDLMGGRFFIDDYAWAVDGVAGRDQLKYPGDIIKVDNSALVHFGNVFAKAAFNGESVNAFFAIGLNANTYQRIDRYNYVENQKSEVVNRGGFDVRGGLSYTFYIAHQLYANTAYLSRAPYYKYVFGNFTNVPVSNIKNEHISTFELGYRYNSRKLKAELNGFYTDWGNVSMLSNEYVQLEDNQQSRAMVNGLHAVHMGVEATLDYQLGKNAQVGILASVGDYRWKNDIQATLLNNDNVVTDTIMVMAKNLKVGGTAQQQVGAHMTLRVLKLFEVKAEWVYYNDFYAMFDPVTRDNPADRSQPYKIPAFQTVNVFATYHGKVLGTPLQIQFNVNNVFNDIHLVYAVDGANHDLSTVSGFWSFGRTFDVMLKLQF